MSGVTLNADAGLQSLVNANTRTAVSSPLDTAVLPKTGASFALNTDVVNGLSPSGDTVAQDEQTSLSQVADALTETMSMMKKGLEFKVDEVEGLPVVSVVDVDSGELIRQIPSEEALKLAEKMSEVAGLLMKTEA